MASTTIDDWFEINALFTRYATSLDRGWRFESRLVRMDRQFAVLGMAEKQAAG